MKVLVNMLSKAWICGPRLLGFWVRIRASAWIFVSSERRFFVR